MKKRIVAVFLVIALFTIMAMPTAFATRKITILPGGAIGELELNWMRSDESVDAATILKYADTQGIWSYDAMIEKTPLRYFANNEILNQALGMASNGQEWLTSSDKHLIGNNNVWDNGVYFDKYKAENGNVAYDWASWDHHGQDTNKKNKVEYSLRRFTTYTNFTESDLAWIFSDFTIAPKDELGNKSYLMPINDTIFVFVNGTLAYWGGTDIVEGKNQYEALLRTEFGGKDGIAVRNGVNGVLKDVYPHTDGWCIDLEKNAFQVDIKSLLKAGTNRIDVFADDFYEGGGMNKLYMFLGLTA